MKLEDLLGQAGFPPASRREWLQLVDKALAGRSFEEALVSRSDDGFRIEPIHEPDRQALPQPRRRPAMPWKVVQRIDDPDPERANRQAHEDIEGGATGLSLVFEGAPNAFGYGLPATEEALETALACLPLNRLHLRMDAHPTSRLAGDWLVDLLARRQGDATGMSLSLGIDPAAIFAGTGRLRMSIEALQASMAPSLAHFFAIGVPGVVLEADGRVYHNAGATEGQELGAMLAAGLGHLRLFESARQALIYAAPHVGFAVSTDQDQFLSMAKIRALRKLWAKVQQECSIPPAPAAIHAETSYRMMAAGDPETNILRSTIATLAAGTGGADSISVLPHTVAHGLADGQARRIGRNTQLVMIAESHLDFLADPGCGSGAVEALTDALCTAAWDEFRSIEKEGGILQSLAAGHLQGRILAARAERARRYRDGERHIVGTTMFPPHAERPVTTLPAERRTVDIEAAATCRALEPMRLDETAGASR